MTGDFRTIRDLELAFYGLGSDEYLRKDEQITSGTANYRNVLFGRKLWQGIVTSANTLGVLRQEPWRQSGFRAISVAGSTGSAGVSEGGSLPATTKPSLVQVTVPAKDLAVTLDISLRQSLLEGKDDTAFFADILEYTGNEFKNRINRGLNANVTNLPTTNIESVDRAISSYAEVTNCGDITAGDADFQGQDRDAGATWMDAYVSHNSDTNRDLQTSHIDTVLQNIQPFWDDYGSFDGHAITTGYDTLARLQQLQRSQLRYDVQKVRYTVNGVKTVEGTDTGFTVASYNHMPIVPDGNVVQDTLSRINLIDTKYLFMGVLQPILYRESNDIILLSKLATKGAFYMLGELIGTKFGCHGKVRDLQ